jgi:hypothetical protein
MIFLSLISKKLMSSCVETKVVSSQPQIQYDPIYPKNTAHQQYMNKKLTFLDGWPGRIECKAVAHCKCCNEITNDNKDCTGCSHRFLLIDKNSPSKISWFTEHTFCLNRWGRNAVLQEIFCELPDEEKFLQAEVQVNAYKYFETLLVLPTSRPNIYKLNFSNINDPLQSLEFFMGLAYCCEINLIIRTKNGVNPKIIINCTFLNDGTVNNLLNKPFDACSNGKIYRYNAGMVDNFTYYNFTLSENNSFCNIL